MAIFERISVWIYPSRRGHAVLILEDETVWSFSVSFKDDFDIVTNPVAIFLWLRGSSDIHTRSILCLSKLLFVPHDQLAADILRVIEAMSRFNLILDFLVKMKPWERAILVVLAC